MNLMKHLDRSPIERENDRERNDTNKSFSKVAALHLAVMCFSTYCLSCIAVETSGRSPVMNTVTKSAAFNALFRRTYNTNALTGTVKTDLCDLRIVIHIKNIITGLISTVMIIFGDKYGIPYLYLPWLVDTMKGMVLNEGPTLFNLANALLPNITFAAGTFVLTTFFLYAEEFFIWKKVFMKFQECWKNYYEQKQIALETLKEKLFIARNKKILCQESSHCEPNIVEKLRIVQKPVEIYNKTNSQHFLDSHLRYIKSDIGDNNNFIRNQSLNMTG